MEHHWNLRCVTCGKTFEDQGGFRLACDQDHPPALLRTLHRSLSFSPRDENPGIFRYASWMPVMRSFPWARGPIVFESDSLARSVGLQHLFIAFSGYWPERGAFMESCSFKELEALAVCAAIPDATSDTLVICSAGNTGRAFIQTASRLGIKALVVVPESAASDIWTTVDRHPAARLAIVGGGADYTDAISVGARICSLTGYYPEGGARNTARRDGLGTVLLAAVEKIGAIPQHFVQAVGSGTGGIAAWEMNQRLNSDGRFGTRLMKLHLVQNEPFAIMHAAWRQGCRELPAQDESQARRCISQLHSRVLGNRAPPYSIAGGVFDALRATNGEMYAVDNGKAREAGIIFKTLEGLDLDPAAEVALAGLSEAVSSGKIPRNESVLLNLTGGGRARLARDRMILPVRADITIQRADTCQAELAVLIDNGRKRES